MHVIRLFFAPIKPIFLVILLIALGAYIQSLNLLQLIFIDYYEDIEFLIQQHFYLLWVSGSLAIVCGLLLGILLSRPALAKVAEICMQFFNLGSTIPTLAILALSMSFLGIGEKPAIFALWAATLLPIVRNTYTGIVSLDDSLIEAAKGMGMTNNDILWRIQIPNASLIIFAGVRTSMAINVGTVPLAFLIGGGGLGELIFAGIDLAEPYMMLSGAILSAIIAIVVDYVLKILEIIVVPKGINPHFMD